jgi:hypothetical protein
MARTLGIPSRVAVGYTAGRLRSDGWYSVLGKNSHAWPEVWFDGIGWVPFEPTPQRGIPGAQDYTGIAPQQDTSPPDFSNAATESVETLPATPTTIFTPPTTIRPPSAAVPQDPEARRNTPAGNASSAPTDDGGSSVPWVLLGIAVLVAAAILLPAVARRLSRRAARQHGTQQRVAMAWEQACKSAARAGVDGSPSMTSREWATATAHTLPVAARPMASLATVVDKVGYSRPESIDPEKASTYGRDCELWSAQVGRIATDTLSSTDRVKRYFTDWK